MDSKGYQQSKYTRGLERADPSVGSSPSRCAPGLLPIDGWSSSSSFSCFTPCFYPCFSPFPLVFSLLCTSPSSWCVCPSPSLCCSYQLHWVLVTPLGYLCVCVCWGGPCFPSTCPDPPYYLLYHSPFKSWRPWNLLGEGWCVSFVST